ncbi:hypothetical protein FQR65_LT17938 [Abscondita terminalis]|nr:hypothetical protein FQR65_LT17938 [Abscondita terminalis]
MLQPFRCCVHGYTAWLGPARPFFYLLQQARQFSTLDTGSSGQARIGISHGEPTQAIDNQRGATSSLPPRIRCGKPSYGSGQQARLSDFTVRTPGCFAYALDSIPFDERASMACFGGRRAVAIYTRGLGLALVSAIDARPQHPGRTNALDPMGATVQARADDVSSLAGANIDQPMAAEPSVVFHK